jgi:hypothetical protein
MKKPMNVPSFAMVAYLVIIGALVCWLTTNPFILTLIERAIETRMNPFNVMDWIWIFIGS